MEDQIREAILTELRRQSQDGELEFERAASDRVRVKGEIDLDALTLVIVGSLAGGP